MKGFQQGSERRIAAVLRMALVAALLLLQIALIVLLAYLLEQRAAIVYALLQATGFAVAVKIYNRRGDAMYKFTWIILILTIPVVGLILYLLWGGDSQYRRLVRTVKYHTEEPESRRKSGEISAERLANSFPAWLRLAESLRKRGFALFQNTEIQYFSEGKFFLEDLIEQCGRAERFIFLEYFILAEGKIWNRLFSILREKAQAGVEIKIIFDDFGNIMRFHSETLEQLREAGIEVFIFNPVHRYVNRLYFNYRDHRKIACIDGDIAYTGGVNIADEYANLITRFGYWKDSGVRLAGEGAWGLTARFIEMLNFLKGETHFEIDYYRPHGDYRSAGWCQPFCDGPQNNPDNPAEDAYLQLISNARKTVYIATPYFIPDDNVLRALCIAGDGGVDVHLVLPAIPDHRYTDLVAESYFGELLEHSIKIYRYTPGFLHQKCIVADQEAAIVGSVNMDYRSFELHYECAVVMYGCDVIGKLAEDLTDIIEKSHRVTTQEWKKRGYCRRLIEPVLRLFAIWM